MECIHFPILHVPITVYIFAEISARKKKSSEALRFGGCYDFQGRVGFLRLRYNVHLHPSGISPGARPFSVWIGIVVLSVIAGTSVAPTIWDIGYPSASSAFAGRGIEVGSAGRLSNLVWFAVDSTAPTALEVGHSLKEDRVGNIYYIELRDPHSGEESLISICMPARGNRIPAIAEYLYVLHNLAPFPGRETRHYRNFEAMKTSLHIPEDRNRNTVVQLVPIKSSIFTAFGIRIKIRATTI